MRFKIILVPFPFDDASQTKVRPAVCLTDKIGKYQHIVVAFITSQTPSEILPSDIKLKNDNITGLKVISYLRLHRSTTIPDSLITRELGIVPEPNQTEIVSQLKLLLQI